MVLLVAPIFDSRVKLATKCAYKKRELWRVRVNQVTVFRDYVDGYGKKVYYILISRNKLV